MHPTSFPPKWLTARWKFLPPAANIRAVRWHASTVGVKVIRHSFHILVMHFVRRKSPFLAVRFAGYTTQHASHALTKYYSHSAGVPTISKFLQKSITAQIISSLTYSKHSASLHSLRLYLAYSLPFQEGWAGTAWERSETLIFPCNECSVSHYPASSSFSSLSSSCADKCSLLWESRKSHK